LITEMMMTIKMEEKIKNPIKSEKTIAFSDLFLFLKKYTLHSK